MFKAVIQQGNLENRRAIYIANSLIDKSLFPTEKKYWISISALIASKAQ
jgi:hypothetical protein